MNYISPKVYKQLFIYLIPTICIILTNNTLLHPSYLFFLAIFSSMLPPFFSSKMSLIISSFLFFLSVISPYFYYFSYGFIISHAYNTKILISSEKNRLYLIIFKIECILFIISQALFIPLYIQLFMSLAVIISSVFASAPPCECLDPYYSMKSLILSGKSLPTSSSNCFLKANNHKIPYKPLIEKKVPSITTDFNNSDNKTMKYSTLLSKEYKTYITDYSSSCLLIQKLNDIVKPDFGLFYLMNLLSSFNFWTCIFILFNFYRFKFTVFLIVFFVFFGFHWEWLGIFGTFTFSGSVTARMMTGYLTYIVIISMQRYFLFNKI